MALPKVGNKAPAFTLPNQDGEKIKLSDFRGEKHVVLYFYPKDDTPGCTKEACGFTDAMTKLKRAGAIIIGVSPDSPAKHAKFIGKYKLKVELVADEDKKVIQKYGCWVKKKLYGREYMGVARNTFLIDKEGTLRHVFEKVKPEGHAEEVLVKLKEL